MITIPTEGFPAFQISGDLEAFFGCTIKVCADQGQIGLELCDNRQNSAGVAAATISNRGSRPSDSVRSWLPMRFRSAIKNADDLRGRRTGGGMQTHYWTVLIFVYFLRK